MLIAVGCCGCNLECLDRLLAFFMAAPANATAATKMTMTMPAAKPAAKPETKPAAKPETKPAAKPETKPAAKPAVAPTTKPATNATVVGRTAQPVAAGNKTTNGTAAGRAGIGRFEFISPDTPPLIGSASQLGRKL